MGEVCPEFCRHVNKNDHEVPMVCSRAAEKAVTGVVLRMLCDYEMRILGRIESYPCKLLLLAKRQPDEQCPERLLLALDLLTSPDHGFIGL